MHCPTCQDAAIRNQVAHQLVSLTNRQEDTVKADLFMADQEANRSVSFLQMHAAAERSALRGDAMRYLQRRAKELHSDVLTSFVQRAAENPFAME